jgi:hypothetical protein
MVLNRLESLLYLIFVVLIGVLAELLQIEELRLEIVTLYEV